MKFHRLLMIGLLALFAAGCASNDIPDPEADTGGGFEAEDNSAETDGFGEDGMGDGEEFSDDFSAEEEMTMIIYFDFDQSELRAEYSDLLARHAANLSNNRRYSVRLEGHTDERGSREYNIGLGERRSQSVRRLLLIQGAAADQISTVSFGEERPAAFGSDEESHQMNRRVEITYTN
jgi:peptidoglycan-associated lipoprotein